MRFKKGSKVEVLSKKKGRLGLWRSAEIISGNGHTYTVRYDELEGSEYQTIVEKVSRKAIRPLPPPLEVSENWAPGDIVEVFYNSSWELAMVSKVLGKSYFLVRILGFSSEFKVSKFDIRARRFWQNDEWVIIGKASCNYENGKRNENLNLKYNQSATSRIRKRNRKINFRLGNGSFTIKERNFPESHNNTNSKTLKRKPNYHSEAEEISKPGQKFSAVEKDGNIHRMVVSNPFILQKQVEMGKKYMHTSMKSNANGLCDMYEERRKRSNDTESASCSVGSCSITSKSSDQLPCRFSKGLSDGNSSDAESFCHLGSKENCLLFPTKEDLKAEIHRLELHAYRRTMEALHASGPLSWEQEAMVTDLRISLHISNDEHLMEIKNLVSSDTSIPIR